MRAVVPEALADALAGLGISQVERGRFGANMQFRQLNDGPVTLTGGGAVLAGYPEGGRQAAVSHKGDVDLVTEVELAYEAEIRRVRAHHTPEIAILGRRLLA